MSKEARMLQQMLPHIYKDPSYLELALTAGDSESEDREGQRGYSQVGDALLRFIILSEGFRAGLSRKEQQESLSALSSKDDCAKLARRLGIDRLIKCSPRQISTGPQPVTLKNTLSAIVATAYYDSSCMEVAFPVMASLGFVNRPQDCVCPQDLTLATPTSSPDPNMDTLIDVDAGNAGDAADSEDWTVLFPSFQFTACQLDLAYSPLSPQLSSAAGGASDQEQRDAVGNYMTQAQGEHSVESRPVSLNPPELESELNCESSCGDHLKHASISRSVSQNENREPNLGSASEVLHPKDSHPSRAKRRRVPVRPFEHQGSEKESRAILINEKRRRCREPLMHRIRNRCMMYIEAEMPKGGKGREELDAYLSKHSDAICSLDASNPDMLLQVALGIGSRTAMLTLQQAVESVRSQSIAEAVRVSHKRSPEERLAAIRYLELRMAHFRLARCLHIYYLYLEAQTDCTQIESDGFVFVTAPPQPASQIPPKYGNPRYHKKAQVTNAMVDRGCAHLDRQGMMTQRRESFTKLRRFGERLKKLEDKFSIGIFALLSDVLDENMKVTATVVVLHC